MGRSGLKANSLRHETPIDNLLTQFLIQRFVETLKW
jgi:hypothetical protein